MEEKEAVRTSLGLYYCQQNVLPGKAEIMSCLQQPALKRRTWTNVKDFVRNMQLTSKLSLLSMSNGFRLSCV